MVLDYEITKKFLFKKYWNPTWSDADFEDRYHDSWELMLRYGVPDGINPLTAMCTVFRTWHSRKQETKRQLKGEYLVTYLSDEALADVDGGYHLDTDSLLLKSQIDRLELSPYHQAVMLMKLAGYSNVEIGNEFGVSDSRIHEIWMLKVVHPVVHGCQLKK